MVHLFKGALMGTPNLGFRVRAEPQEHNRNLPIPGPLYSNRFLLYSWASLFGVPIKVPVTFGTLTVRTPSTHL